MASIDFYNDSDVIAKVREIDEKLSEGCDGKQRTKLMFEQLLRGLYLNNPYEGQYR